MSGLHEKFLIGINSKHLKILVENTLVTIDNKDLRSINL